MEDKEVLYILEKMGDCDYDWPCRIESIINVPYPHILKGGKYYNETNTKEVHEFVKWLRDLADGVERLA